MKKTIVWFLLMIMLVSCSSCGQQKEKEETVAPQVSQMKSICELATMDCYYHNVAKYKEEDASGMLFWKKDKQFWVEYAGVVTIGIDASLVNIEVVEQQVTITMPPAKVLECKVDPDTLSEESFIVARNSADVTAEDQTKAFKEAQVNMEQSAANDTALLASAQQRAQKLLEDYVNNIGSSVGKEYTIQWQYIEEKPEGDESTGNFDALEEENEGAEIPVNEEA